MEKTSVKKALVFGLWLIIFFSIGLMLTTVVGGFMGMDTTPHMRVVTVVQDMLAFILPAVLVAMRATRLPARWLSVERLPGLAMTLCAVVFMAAMMPLMNSIIAWNEAWQLPPAVEAAVRAMEDAAEGAVNLLMGGTAVADLVMGILIVGILTGLAEELFFRGAVMRILSRGGRVTHTAVWLTALIFSLVHFQAYGFVPRLLLGVFFGYVVMWSGSLWLSAGLHALNNSLVVIARWSGNEEQVNAIGSDSMVIIVMSAAAVAILLYAMWRLRVHGKEKSSNFAKIFTQQSDVVN